MSSTWVCIECGLDLGEVVGSEYTPSENVPQKNIHTRGPNLSVQCPQCGQVKIFYTSDPVVRAMYQLIDAITTTLARRLMSQLSDATMKQQQK